MIKKFIHKTLAFGLLLLSLSILSFFLTSLFVKKQYPNAYTAIIKDKIKRLEESKGNNIILMGGSHTSTSIDSKLISKKLNRKVINSATVFNTGYLFQLNVLKKYAKKNDIVIFIPEFAYYSNSGRKGSDFLFNAFMYEIKLANVIGFENWQKYSTQFLRININPFKRYLRKADKKIVNKGAFNIFGDDLNHINKKPKLNLVRSFPLIKTLNINSVFIEELIVAKEVIESKGAKFYVTFPAYSKNFLAEQVIFETNRLKSNYNFFFGDLSDILYDDFDFYDSPYHMIGEQRISRTKNLIKYLKAL